MADIIAENLVEEVAAQKDGVGAALTTVSTTAALADVDDAINTEGKYTGKQVWNSDTGIPVWADGPAADDTWSGADGAVDHTPV